MIIPIILIILGLFLEAWSFTRNEKNCRSPFSWWTWFDWAAVVGVCGCAIMVSAILFAPS